ncbi:MAG TPA: hypothetical protein VF656_04570 [Pyrinomonadaceae bacterium]|jgi:hypothetical protein
MQSSDTENTSETRILSAVVLTCYVTLLGALAAAAYSIFSLAACALGSDIFDAYSRQLL